MVKIIHCADLHLDSPFSSFGFRTARLKRELLLGTFTSLILYARMEKADMMLLPGDIFDVEYVGRDTVAKVIQQFEQTPDCRFVIAPGNHDPYRESSPYKHEKFPDNVYIFTSPMMSKFSFDDIGVDVYGFAFTSSAMETCPIKDTVHLDPDRINLLCAHADMASGSAYCPVTERDLAEAGFDYAALGHIHNSDGIHLAGNTYYGYSGCPEGRGWDETGEKSVIMLKAEKKDGVFTPVFTKKQLTKRRYEVCELDVTAAGGNADVINAVNELIYANKYDSDTSLRVTLCGELSSDVILSVKAISESVRGLGNAEIKDETRPLLNTSELESDPTVRGAFYAQLVPMLNSDDPEERELAYDALKYGLAALGRM